MYFPELFREGPKLKGHMGLARPPLQPMKSPCTVLLCIGNNLYCSKEELDIASPSGISSLLGRNGLTTHKRVQTSTSSLTTFNIIVQPICNGKLMLEIPVPVQALLVTSAVSHICGHSV